MYKLYNVKAWGSMGAHFLLEEMAVPYTNIWMTPEQVAAPEFRGLSPLGYIPALGLDDGSTLFESAAIVSFLVAAHPDKGMAPQPGSNEYGEFLSWLHFMSTNLYAAHQHGRHRQFLFAQFDGRSFPFGKIDREMQRALGHPGQAPGGEGPWLMGENFSALDLYAFMLFCWSRPNETALHAEFPAIAKLAQAVRARPKLKAALEAHGVMEPRS